MIRWITGKYGDLIPLAVLVLVLAGVYFVARGRGARPDQLRAEAESNAREKAVLISDHVGNAVNERLGALTTAELQFTTVEDSVSQRVLLAALDTVTSRLSGLMSISVLYPDGTLVRGPTAAIGRPGAALEQDTVVQNPMRRALMTRRIAASSQVDVPVGRRIFVFHPVVRGDSLDRQIVGFLVGELDPSLIIRSVVARPEVADSLAGSIYQVYGPNGGRITSSLLPPNWQTLQRPIRVADTEWLVEYAYPPLDLRGWRAEMIAIWVVGTVVALALAGVLLVLRRTVTRQREEIARRQAAEESARTSASEARQRAREARELAAQLEAATLASQRLSTSLNPDDVVELFLGGVAEILDADVASLYTFEEEGEVLIGRRRIVFREVGPATQRLKKEDIRHVRAKVEMLPSIAEAVATGEPYVELGQTARTRPIAAVTGGSEAAASTVTIPLLIAGHMVGVATWEVYGEAREFSPAVIAFAQAMAAPAAAALRTAELFSSLEEERARVRREALRFGAVLDQMADGVVVVDQTGKVERFNKAAEELLGSEIHGLRLDEWPTRFNLGTEDGRPLPAGEFPLLRAMRGDRIRRGMFIVRSIWGTERHVACSAGPILTARGEPAGAAMVIRDVSDEHQYAEMLRHTNRELRRQAEVLEEVNQQLREATKAKDQFLAVMSHELRTPINAIMGYSDLLDLGVKGELNPDQQAMVTRVRETSRHLLGLINEVLDLAKIGSGRIDLVLAEVDVSAIVERAAQQILPMATAKKLTLETISDMPPNVPARVIADETRLAQIVINLLSNAVKFTSTGRVSVRYGLHGERIAIAVRDTGPGIPAQQLDRIFEEFYQIEGGLSRSTGGTGLGLAIARRFAQLMGGDITVQSEIGAGSEFVLTLPQARREMSRDGTAPVIVLAGSDEIADRIAADLDHLRVAGTTEPARLLSLAHVEAPELIVLDLGAPAHGGWRTLLAIQQVPDIGRVPVLLLGRDRKSDTAIDLGRVRVLPRPFSATRTSADVAAAIGPENTAPVLIAIDEQTIRADLEDTLARAGYGVITFDESESTVDLVLTQPVSAIVVELMLQSDSCALGLLAKVRADAALRELPVFLLMDGELGPEDLARLDRVIDRLARDGKTPHLPVAELIRAALDESAPVEAS